MADTPNLTPQAEDEICCYPHHRRFADLLAAAEWALTRATIEGPVLTAGYRNVWRCYSCKATETAHRPALVHTASCLWEKARAAIAKASPQTPGSG